MDEMYKEVANKAIKALQDIKAGQLNDKTISNTLHYEQVIKRWGEAALESIIKEMQVIEAEAKEIDPPSCALEAESALTSYMWTMIQGYFKLFVQEFDITPLAKMTTDDEFTLAASKLEYYETKMEELRNLLLEKSKSE